MFPTIHIMLDFAILKIRCKDFLLTLSTMAFNTNIVLLGSRNQKVFIATQQKYLNSFCMSKSQSPAQNGQKNKKNVFLLPIG